MPSDHSHDEKHDRELKAVEAHLAWLEAIAASPESLVELDPESLLRLRQAAGRVALPDRLARRKHQSSIDEARSLVPHRTQGTRNHI